MKKILSLFVLLALFIVAGCSEDPVAPGGGGGLGGGGNGGGGGGTGNVTVTTSLVQDQQQQLYFEFKPSTAVVVAQIVAVCQPIGINQPVAFDNATVYNNTNPFYITIPSDIQQQLQQGQQWQFTITGKVGSATGASFTSTVNYTIQ